MSARQITRLKCATCAATLSGPSGAARARKWAAAEYGWAEAGGIDVCMNCRIVLFSDGLPDPQSSDDWGAK